MARITIHNDAVEAELDDLKTTITFPKLLDILRRRAMPNSDSQDFINPHGVRKVWRRGAARVFLLEIPWGVHRLSWITDDSPARFGPGTKYEDRILACPWILMLVSFIEDARGRLVVDRKKNEIFFATEGPVTDLDDADYLRYPSLLNCSKFKAHERDDKPLSWLCTQQLPVDELRRITNNNSRIAETFKAVRSLIFESSSNYSSEHHEETSWYTAQARKLPQLRDVKNWERLSKKNPAFILQVPFRNVEMSCNQVVDRLFNIMGALSSPLASTDDLVCMIFNHSEDLDPFDAE